MQVSFERAIIRRAKQVRALSSSFVTPADYTKLRRSMQAALWAHNNEIIWGRLTEALGDRYSYLLACMNDQGGLKAWAIANRRYSESSAASESHYLQLFLAQKLEASAEGNEPPSMRSYIEKLIRNSRAVVSVTR